MKEVSIHVGQRIRLYRKTKNLTIETFAGMIHKSKATVSKYENGDISIDIETLFTIAQALGVPVNQLIDYEEIGEEKGEKGEIIKHNGRYYEIKVAHTSNAAAYPVETTFAYYRLIELSATGTLDDPIPYPETAGYTLQKQICRIAFIRRTRRACGNGKK